ncbi:ferritin-like domain-containing protein [Candidatus Deferrimicrobium sp.]|uniref:ferritin-like domain-containing protein n=1 Tax=Candidatus Deferrimicrobium sp. TaxID=3060586 RepID=UPI00351CFF83
MTAISQYMVHSEMCANWGYEKLHKHFGKRAIEELQDQIGHMTLPLFLTTQVG